ncbi:MAG: hypothetical protein LKJ88_00665 [Bacilli bacterium]|jgi:hypothetical protein|nr:hypothetical protein [Bacilli bacterium]
MDEKTTYQELIQELKNPADPLFGGSLAYIQIEESLAMTEKLLQIKLKKPSSFQNDYLSMISVTSIVGKQSHEMIVEDGETFNKLRLAPTQEEKDEVVKALFPKSLAFLSNLDLLMTFLEKLCFYEKTSMQYDYLMIRDSLWACYNNLIHILKYEIKKMSEGEVKDGYNQKAEALLARESWLDKQLKENSNPSEDEKK